MSDSDDSDDSRGRGGGIGGFKNNMEEFKMHEDDDEDHVDLLAEKKRLCFKIKKVASVTRQRSKGLNVVFLLLDSN